MLLVIDVGNSNIVYGLFEGKVLIHQFRVETGRSRTADEYRVVLHQLLAMNDVAPGQITAAALASVVPSLTEPMAELVRRGVRHASRSSSGPGYGPGWRSSTRTLARSAPTAS